jgi:hypothetical protein
MKDDNSSTISRLYDAYRLLRSFDHEKDGLKAREAAAVSYAAAMASRAEDAESMLHLQSVDLAAQLSDA